MHHSISMPGRPGSDAGSLTAVSAVLHLAATVTDEVHSFLGPATRELRCMGRQQSVVLFDEAPTRGNIDQLRRHAKVVAVAWSRSRYVRYRRFYQACCEEILGGRPGTIHFHGIVPCVIGSLALRKCGVEARVIYSPHGSRSLTTLRIAGWATMALARPLIRPAQSSAIATFPLEAEALASWGSRRVVESPVHERFLEVGRDESRQPLVLSGGMDPGAPAIGTLSQIAVLLGADELGIRFRWLGRMDPDTAACFDAAGIRIVDIDRQERHASELSRGWLYVAPWGTRGYPLFLIQAMAAGLPSVVLDCPQHRQVVEHGRTGFLCATEDDMVRAVASLIDDAALRRRMGDAARDSARERFGASQFRSLLWSSYAPGRSGT